MAKKRNRRGAIYLPPEVWRNLRLEAARRGMSMSAIVAEALQARVVVTKHGDQQGSEKK